MNTAELDTKWEILEANFKFGAGQLIRFPNPCIPDLNLWIHPDGYRGLALKVPDLANNFQRPISKKNLVMEHIEAENMLAIMLLENTYNTHFNDLILSIYNAIYDVKSPQIYGDTFLKMFSMWIQFFEPIHDDRLSDDEIQGLFGELHVLENFVKESSSMEINAILSAWRGPYNEIHDFVFSDTCCEVKTVGQRSMQVRIANELQLEGVDDKSLELIVVRTTLIDEEGMTLAEKIINLRELCEERSADLTILYQALLQKNLSWENLENYSHLSFSILSVCSYDCLLDGFPKITSATTLDAILNVKYSINLNSLERFKLSDMAL